ncbi:MAG: glycosyltransferase family 4 protein [Candidatus Buchananbacteria bacterium]|nr:glycosyltransferase family 4 protein [Candidatus Buchananbacteria bacterium]
MTQRILIATGIFPPDIGGPATYAQLLVNQLPARGVAVSLVSFGTVRHLIKGWRHIVYGYKLWRGSAAVDTIYALDPLSVGLPAAVVACLRRKRFVLRVAGDYAWEQGTQRFGVTDTMEDFSQKHGYRFPIPVFKLLQYWIACQASLVIVPSEYLKKIVSNWGVPESKITVVYNAFDVPEFKSKTEVRQQLGVAGQVLVSVGRLVKWKGFDVVIDVVVQLRSKFPELKLYIIGEGPEREQLQKKIAAAQLTEHIILVGQVSQQIVLNYARAADVFVLNTGYEGFSHLLLEVMAAETPIVTTNIGGNPELITDQVSGLLVTPNDQAAVLKSIEQILADSVLATKLTTTARHKVAAFNEERMLKELVAVL